MGNKYISETLTDQSYHSQAAGVCKQNITLSNSDYYYDIL